MSPLKFRDDVPLPVPASPAVVESESVPTLAEMDSEASESSGPAEVSTSEIALSLPFEKTRGVPGASRTDAPGRFTPGAGPRVRARTCCRKGRSPWR